MKATPLIDERRLLAPDGEVFLELVLWLLPRPLPLSKHPYKYRMAFVDHGSCIVRYDNEIAKGDHRHAPSGETGYEFTTPETLLVDFLNDVNKWRQ